MIGSKLFVKITEDQHDTSKIFKFANHPEVKLEQHISVTGHTWIPED